MLDGAFKTDAFEPVARRKPQRYRGIARICNDATGTKARFQVSDSVQHHTSFTRAIWLPDDVEPAQVQANHQDGVLRATVARREAAQPKRITVQ